MHMPKTGTRTAAARFRQNSPGRTLAPQTGTKIAPSRQHSPSRMHAYAQNRHRNSAVRIQTPAVQSGPHSQKSAPAQRGSGSAVGAKFPNEAPEHRGLDNTFRAACPKQAHAAMPNSQAVPCLGHWKTPGSPKLLHQWVPAMGPRRRGAEDIKKSIQTIPLLQVILHVKPVSNLWLSSRSFNSFS